MQPQRPQLSGAGGVVSSVDHHSDGQVAAVVQSFADRDDLYSILGVGKDATAHDLRRAYLALCRVWNPSSAARRRGLEGDLTAAVDNHRPVTRPTSFAEFPAAGRGHHLPSCDVTRTCVPGVPLDPGTPAVF
jgi:hypothetical protein